MSSVRNVDDVYLRQAGELVRGAKVQSYERMRLEPGMSVLDVGCGPGIDTVAMARLVGAGQVTGIDADPEMVRKADDSAEKEGVAGHVRHLECCASALPFPDQEFGAVRSERLFQHLREPAAALEEMVRVTRRGGRVVVLDTDWGSHSANTSDPGVERALARALTEASLANGYSGRRLYGHLKTAGLLDVSVEVIPLRFTDYDFWRMITRQDQVEEDALLAGVATADALAGWRTAMRDQADAGTFYASVNMVLVAGTRPDA